jgi:hypothetical protein
MQEGRKLDQEFWKNKGVDLSKIKWSSSLNQKLSHQSITMRIGILETKTALLDSTNYFSIKKIKAIPFPRIISRWWEKAT